MPGAPVPKVVSGSVTERFAAQSVHPPVVTPRNAMHAFVYKSLKKTNTFVYFAARDDFSRLPEPLVTQLGKLQFVLQVDLVPDRKLAQEDPDVVRANLVSRGFHVQFPPTMADPMTEDWGTDG